MHVGRHQLIGTERLLEHTRFADLLAHGMETVQDVLQGGIVLVGDLEQNGHDGDAILEFDCLGKVGESTLMRNDVQFESVSVRRVDERQRKSDL